VAGRCVLVWSWGPALGGSVVWGRPGEADVEQFFVLTDAYRLSSPGCDVVTDVSRVDSVESTLYAAFVEGMRGRAAHFANGIRRHALVRPEGLVGGLAEGFFPISGVQHDWRVFPDAAAAFGWLDRPGADVASREVERLVDEARGLSPELRGLRDYLRAHLQDARLFGAAAVLGTSERSLHRTLREAKTCFRDELGAARVDTARRLLAETDLKIQEIARRVGYSTHSHLTTVFTRSTGQSPAAYREEARGKPPPRDDVPNGGDSSPAPRGRRR
jgi:AraC-like DNA-binding protein